MLYEIRAMIIADAHVHIHDCFELSAFLDAAFLNFSRAAGGESSDGFTGILLLSESAGANWYEQLYSAAGNDGKLQHLLGSWQIRRTVEDCSLVVEKPSGMRLCMIAGRQIVTKENLEVLALGTARHFPDGRPIDEVIAAVRECDALAVLPWGAGKWLGERGRILSRLLEGENGNHDGLMLGDNGGRPAFLGEPRLFARAKALGIRILPGSDPLPMPGEIKRVGSFGFLIDTNISLVQPASELRTLLRDKDVAIHSFGRLQSPLMFFVNQIKLRLRTEGLSKR